MTDVVQGHRFAVALAKQSAEGTAATVADYQIPAADVSFLPREDRKNYEALDGAAYFPGQFKSKAWADGTIEFFAFPDSVGRLLTAVLGLDTVTGTTPKIHTITSNNAPHWMTIWVNRPLAGVSNEYDRYVDCLFKTCTIIYAAGELLHVKIDVIAKQARVKATTPTITVTNTLDTVGGFFTWAGPTMLADFAVTPAATAQPTISSFELMFGYPDADLIQTQSLGPSLRSLKRFAVALSANYYLPDWAAYYATFFGATAPAANTDQSPVVTRGSADITLQTVVVNANTTLQLKLPSIEPAITAPQPNTAGDGLVATLTGVLEKPTAGEAITLVLQNAVATSYSA